MTTPIENLAASRKRAAKILADPKRVELLSAEPAVVVPMSGDEFLRKYGISA